MANELNRKVVLIRKKPEELKVEQLAKPTPDELTSATKGGGPTEKQRQRRKRHIDKWQRGESWAAACAICHRHRALESVRCEVLLTGNRTSVFTRMIREAVAIAEKTEAAP